jgi:hypothetical protein
MTVYAVSACSSQTPWQVAHMYYLTELEWSTLKDDMQMLPTREDHIYVDWLNGKWHVVPLSEGGKLME